MLKIFKINRQQNLMEILFVFAQQKQKQKKTLLSGVSVVVK